ncbi:MAG: hypothetical protein KA004_13995 [Verrucomicrobiales bacterium]|nr:hypothetical protein [Verrucomicrobiales bacterium]
MLAELQLHPVFGVVGEVVIALLAGAALVWNIRRVFQDSGRFFWISALRITGLLALLTLFFQAQYRHETVRVIKPRLAVLVDASESMTDQPDPRQPTRESMVRLFLKEAIPDSAQQRFEVELFSFAGELKPLGEFDLEAVPAMQGHASNVVAAVDALKERYRGQSLAAILLLSDGIDTSGSRVMSGRVDQGRVCTFELEKPFTVEKAPQRISLEGVDYLPRVVVGWESEITVRLNAQGLKGQAVTVELWRDGAKASESAAAFQEDQQSREVIFPVVHDRVGKVSYEVRIAHAAATAEAKNHPFSVEVVEAGSRVLYLQNSLSFDFKFLRKAIVADRNLDLRSYVRWGDGRLVSIGGKRGVDAAAAERLDLSESALTAYAAVILGDLPADALRPENHQALSRYVENGGGLILLGGSKCLATAPGYETTAMANLLPVQTPAAYLEGNFPVQISEAGLRHPVFGPLFEEVGKFPPLLTTNATPAAKSTAEVLLQTTAQGRTVPLVAALRVGHGKVVAVLTDTLWRWRLASDAWRGKISPYETFWAQLMDWMLPKDDETKRRDEIELVAERSRYLHGEKPELRAIVRQADPKAVPPASVALEVHTPDGKVFQYAMNKARFRADGENREIEGYAAAVEPHLPGIYKAVASFKPAGDPVTGEASFAVDPPPTEITGRPIDRDRLQQLAQRNGGKFYSVDDWQKWPADVTGQEQRFSRVQLASIWNHPLMLGLIVLCLAAEWFLRRRWNLP